MKLVGGTVIVARADGGSFLSDRGSVAKEVRLTVSCRPDLINISKHNKCCLDVGNFGWNICAIHRCNHGGYSSVGSMRSAVGRMLKSVGFKIIRWEE